MKNNTSQIQTNDKQKPNAQEDNTQNENFKYRKSPRASFHNYSGGIYFITICTNNKIHYFGEITNGKMQLSDIGIFAQKSIGRFTHTLQVCPSAVICCNAKSCTYNYLH